MNGHQHVIDLMHPGVVTCHADTPVTDIVKQMTENRIHALAVVGPQDELLGVVSQSDLLNAGFVEPYERHFEEMRAWQLMTSPAYSVGPFTSLPDAVQIMTQHNLHRLVVIAAEGPQPNRPIGILSVTDLVDYLGKTVAGAAT